MSKLEKVDRAISTIGRVLDMVVTIAGIIAVGFVAHFVLKLMGYESFILWGGTILIALASGFLVRLLFRILAYVDFG